MPSKVIDLDMARMELAYAPRKKKPIMRRGTAPAAKVLKVPPHLRYYASVSLRYVRSGELVLLVDRAHLYEIEEIPIPIPESAYLRYLDVRREGNGVPVEFFNGTGRPDSEYGFPKKK